MMPDEENLYLPKFVDNSSQCTLQGTIRSSRIIEGIEGETEHVEVDCGKFSSNENAIPEEINLGGTPAIGNMNHGFDAGATASCTDAVGG